MAVKVFSICFDLWYHLNYAGYGEDSLVLYVFGSILNMVSESNTVMLLLMIANGWMTTWTKYDFSAGFDTYAPLVLFI